MTIRIHKLKDCFCDLCGSTKDVREVNTHSEHGYGTFMCRDCRRKLVKRLLKSLERKDASK